MDYKEVTDCLKSEREGVFCGSHIRKVVFLFHMQIEDLGCSAP
jgi:hypothetical protein